MPKEEQRARLAHLNECARCSSLGNQEALRVCSACNQEARALVEVREVRELLLLVGVVRDEDVGRREAVARLLPRAVDPLLHEHLQSRANQEPIKSQSSANQEPIER